jgi:hypothetical protein
MEDEQPFIPTKFKRVIIVRASPQKNPLPEKDFSRIEMMNKEKYDEEDVRQTFKQAKELNTKRLTKGHRKKTRNPPRKKLSPQKSKNQPTRRMPRVSRVRSGFNNQAPMTMSEIRILLTSLFFYQVFSLISYETHILSYVSFVISILSLYVVITREKTIGCVRFLIFNCIYQLSIEYFVGKYFRLDIYAIAVETFLVLTLLRQYWLKKIK